MRPPAGVTARLATGLLLVLAPRSTVGLVADRHATGGEVRAATALGVRHLMEVPALLCGGAVAARVVRMVDLLHLSSMLALALVSPSQRRLALVSAASAAVLRSQAHRVEDGG